MENNDSRRGFLKKIGATLTAAAMSTFEVGAVQVDKIASLSPEKQEFLKKYKIWIDNFKKVVEVQKRNLQDVKNNDYMMKLSEEAEAWKSELQSYLLDKDFAEEYLKLTVELTNKIKNDHPFGNYTYPEVYEENKE
jgi:hypothetical protein